MSSKVFVTEDTRHNLAHAMEYGDIEILESADFPLFRNGQEVTDRIRRGLQLFNPEKDFLLLIGDPIIVGLAFAALDRMGHKVIRVLKWDRQSTKYIPVNVPLR